MFLGLDISENNAILTVEKPKTNHRRLYMTWDLKCIVYEFAYRKVKFHNNENWEDIKLFGLFNYGDVSKYLVGNPSKIKSFKKGLVKTNMRKENVTIWCQPTEELWNNYIQPILNSIKDRSIDEQLKYLENFGKEM